MNYFELKGIHAAYGDVQILWDISLTVGKEEVVALVGANGAGKSTTLKVASGLLNPREGQVLMEGKDLSALNASEMVKRGIVQVPEGRKLFNGMTVQENLLMGAYLRQDGQGAIQADMDWVYELFPRLTERRSALAGTMSGGEQQMCAIGRGLMAGPKVILIDELSLGLAPVIVDRLVEIVAKVRTERRISVLLVEQDLSVALSMADRGYVLETGRLVRSGPADELMADKEIQKAYLGL
jgi:branched-chain amino acid transport system ATP-binding protein